MNARDLMTADPACCTPETPIREIARLMVRCDCGEIPVVEQGGLQKPIGVVTDRDIVCRAIAEGKDPATATATDVMSSPAIVVRDTDSEEAVRAKMERHQIRRVPVVDQTGAICGIIALADLARHESRKDIGQVVREVSAPAR